VLTQFVPNWIFDTLMNQNLHHFETVSCHHQPGNIEHARVSHEPMNENKPVAITCLFASQPLTAGHNYNPN
jgi:hypothetical protein